VEHREYQRIVPDANAAILFVHGIVGTPNHFAAFLPLVPETVSVHSLLLDGHGSGAKEFSQTSMKKWESQVAAAVSELAAAHQTVYIVGHSMGCLLAIEQAIANDKVKGLFLLAVPLRASVKLRAVTTSLKLRLGRISPDDHAAMAAKNCCGVANGGNPLYYLGWVPRLLELLAKMRQIRGKMPQLQTPCIAVQSQHDELVSKHTVRLLQQNPYVRVELLPQSGHFYYEKADRAAMLEKFSAFVSDIV